MSHYLKNLIPEQAAVTESSKASQGRTSEIQSEALHRYALFNSPIKLRGKDGRTYDYQDENGKFVSHFISQYSPLIADNLEPGVKLLVRSLHAYGYLTLGSCQGHEDSQFRWVTMVFTQPDDMIAFKNLINSFNLPVSWFENFLNFREKPRIHEDDSFQLNFTWDQKTDSHRSIENLARQGYTEDELTRYLNIMYSRNETKYYLTKMVVASKLGEKTMWETLKWKLIYRKREEITEKLVAEIIKAYS